MPKLSIIVPIYKTEQYLRECLDSILNQTFKDFELILIDDGSPDKCGEICDNYAKKDNRIKVLHIENHGVSYARNLGIKIASGDYICFVDSDDYISINMYSCLLQLAQTRNFDIIGCDYDTFRNIKDITESVIIAENDIEYLDKNQLLNDLFARPSKLKGSSVNKIFKAEVVKAITFDSEIKIWEDLHFLTKLYLSADTLSCAYTKAPLYCYRINNSSASHNENSLSFTKRHSQFKNKIFSVVKKSSPQHLNALISFYLDSCIFHIKNCREASKITKKYYSKNIFQVKISMFYWIVYAIIHKIFTRTEVNKFIVEGIIRS